MTLRVTLRCRRGTYGTGLGVVARLVPVWRRGRRGCLRGRRGTWRHGPSLCATGVALGDINRHFVWPGLALMALGWLWWRAWFPFGAVGAAAVCVAGVVTWTVTYNLSTHNLLTHNLLTRRRGTSRHPPSLCVAGVARMALGWLRWRAWFSGVAVGAAAVCVAGVVLGRSHTTCPHTTCSHTTYSHGGVALRDINRHFVWQAWHLWHWAGSGGAQI